jgi:hypothetical protein
VMVVFGLPWCGGKGSGTETDAAADTDGVSPDGTDSLPGDTGDDTEVRPDFEECAAVSETAVNTRGPADIIFAIDNTPSMYNEIEMVRANMNRFSEMVEAEGLDLHIALVSCRTEACLDHPSGTEWYIICIDPPVGAEGACETADTDDSVPPEYLHVDERVESLKALENIADTYGQWSAILRPGAAKHFVAISDDNEEWTAAQFNETILGLDASLAGYQFHAIFSFMSKQAACDISSSEPCCTYAAPDGEGTVYRELVEMTGGVSADLCLQDFDPVFDALAGAVIASARLNCFWEIPPPPEGEELDPAKVNVDFFDGTTTTMIGHVPTEDRCALVEHGWYYDDPASPTEVHVCPQTCEWIQGREGAQIIIKFGCETEDAPLL